MNPYFTLFGKQIPYYGVLFMGAILIGGVVAVLHSLKRKLKKIDVIYCACFAAVGGIIGAKLLSILTSIEYIIEYKPSFFDVISNGFVFYGGIIGGFIGLAIYCKVFKLPMLDFMDVFAICVPPCHAIGRIGCYISGCCYGIPCDGVLSVVYNSPVDINTPKGVPLLAIQLIEAICLVVLFVVLEIMFFKSKKKGLVSSTYLIAYAVIRFVLEFFRGDLARGLIFGISTSQIISILIVLIVVGIIIYRMVKNKKDNALTNNIQ